MTLTVAPLLNGCISTGTHTLLEAGDRAGIVRDWYADEGWGVIDSQETPGGCWAHVMCVLVPGCPTLRAGQTGDDGLRACRAGRLLIPSARRAPWPKAAVALLPAH